jgi:MarR family
MSRGLGTAQRAILAALREDDDYALSVTELAGKLGRSQRQVRAAVRALEARKLVVITRDHIGWRGAGEYGRLRRSYGSADGDLPRVKVRAGEPWPIPSRRPGEFVASKDVEFVRAGMPTFGLLVWLSEDRERWEAELADFREQFRKRLGLPA